MGLFEDGPPFVYTDAAGKPVPLNTTSHTYNATDCGDATWVANSQQYSFIAYYVVCLFILSRGTRWLMGLQQQRKQHLKERAAAIESAGGDSEEAEGLQARAAQVSRMVFVYIGVALAADIVAKIVVSTASANKLTVPESNSMSDSDNFLNPFADVFVFFEDGMTPRIGQAVGAQDFELVGVLLQWAALGGLACGVLGGGVAILFTTIEPIFTFFVPLRQGATLPTNCAGIPSSISELQALARPYWILSALAWPATFVQSAFIGVFMGTAETLNWAIATVLSVGVTVGLFFGLIDSPSVGHTTAVGISNLVSPYLFVGIAFAVFFGQKKYREQFALSRQNFSDRAGRVVAVEAAKDGLALMLKDLALTVQSSMTSMFLANLGLGQQYRLSILGRLASNFGSGSLFPQIMGYGMRLTGSRMLGAKMYGMFTSLTRGYMLGALLFGLVGTGIVTVFYEGLPYAFAADDICTYQEQTCSLPTYDHIYGSGFTAAYALQAVAIVAQCLDIVSTATLYAALDFEFVRNCTIVVFFVVYLPLAFFAYFVVQTGLSIQVADTVPSLVITCVYLHRVWFKLLPGLRKGEYAEARRRSTVSEINTRLLSGDAGAGGGGYVEA